MVLRGLLLDGAALGPGLRLRSALYAAAGWPESACGHLGPRLLSQPAASHEHAAAGWGVAGSE